jgi:phospho-N-acetylmuramoyl-pentapeptide-transferase
MLYSLFSWLQETYGHFAGARLVTYISFRAITAGVIALCISIWFGKFFIQYMKRHNITETQRDEKTDPFNVAKKGVPTMGGLVVIGAILLPCLLLGKLTNIYMILMLIHHLYGRFGFCRRLHQDIQEE